MRLYQPIRDEYHNVSTNQMTVFIPERDEVLDTGEGTPVTLETLELRQC